MQLHVVAGGAGFIGANLVKRLLAGGSRVIVLDDFSMGQRSFLSDCKNHTELLVRETDCSDLQQLQTALEGIEAIHRVWHLAANSDIAAGITHPDVDFTRTFMTTIGLIKAVANRSVGAFHFASSSAVYGDLGEAIAGETTGPLLPISNYGAMKLASEASLSAAAETGLQRITLLRFPNVVGTPATHGVILDFVRKLAANPKRLDVLGDGQQRKPYLHVADLVDAMMLIDDAARQRRNVINIGPSDDGVTVTRIAELVRACVSPGAYIHYGTEARGWVGDVPRFRYATDRLTDLGWSAQLSSEAAVRRAISEIIDQEGVLCRL